MHLVLSVVIAGHNLRLLYRKLKMKVKVLLFTYAKRGVALA